MTTTVTNISSQRLFPQQFNDQQSITSLFQNIDAQYEQETQFYVSSDKAYELIVNQFLPLMYCCGLKLQKTRTLKETLSINNILDSSTNERHLIPLSVRFQIEDFNHLPKALRDFHDQKDLFKWIDMEYPDIDVNWCSAQVYTIDTFLYVMAAHGYTLQSYKTPFQNTSISQIIKETQEESRKRLGNILKRD